MCGHGCCMHRPEHSVALWPLTAGATPPSAKSNGPQQGQEATQCGGRCLSRNIPSLMTDLFAPVQSLRLPSWGDANDKQTHDAGFVSAEVCVWVGGGGWR